MSITTYEGSLAGMTIRPGTSLRRVYSAGGGDYTTIASAVAAATAGDTLALYGIFSEAVTCAKAGIRFVNPTGNPADAVWTAATDAACLTPTGDNILIEGIKFRPPAYTASRATTAIALSGSSYLTVRKCRFQGQVGSQAAIYSAVCDSDNVTIEDCEFIYMNTATYGAGILGVEADGLSYSGWNIKRNKFQSCVIAININGRVCQVEGNTIAAAGIAATGAGGTVLALGIDLSGTGSYGNQVHGNYLGGAYSATLYKIGATGDDWGGNFNIAGITAANPS